MINFTGAARAIRNITGSPKHMSNFIKSIRCKIKWWLASPEARRHSMVGPMREWRKRRDFQIGFLKQMGLKPQHFLMDIGCGTLRGGIPIIALLEPGHYCGLESRAEVLAEGEKELAEAGLENKAPQLIHSPDVAAVSLDRKFDFVWAFSVLIHMNDEVLDSCLGMVRRHLRDSGAFYANVNLGERADGHWQGFPLIFRSLRFYEDAAQKNNLHVTDLGKQKSFIESGVRAMDEKNILKCTAF